MNALIAYGSLINKSGLTQSGFPLDNTCPVIIWGYKRTFYQEPSWRSDEGEARAVLNVVDSPQHWANALLVSGLNDGFLADLDKREKGYNRTKVDPSHLEEYYSCCTVPNPRNIYVYMGKPDKQSDSILPNSSYLQRCLEGAMQWGEDFHRDFLDSTFVRDNVPLRRYVR